MTRHSLPFLACMIAGTAFAQNVAIPIPILNPGFEADALSCSAGLNCFAGGVTGWLVGPASGIIKPSTAQYPGGIPGGANVAYIGVPPSTGSLMQTLGETVRANATYTLSVAIGHRADEVFTGYVAAITAADVILASDSSLSPASGTFEEDVIVYRSGPNPPQLGRSLAIFIKSFGTGQADVDNVSLTVADQ